MNIREIAHITPNYFEINREERNYAAIFYSALCKPGNAERFLSYCGINNNIGPEFGVYFEYAYLRDIWNRITDEDTKKEIIAKLLPIKDIELILTAPIKNINEKFGVGGAASSIFIEYPGKWAIVKYNENFPDNEDFLRICRFKWSFNIKPDIVIHLDKNNAVCIEAKYESSEGYYPSSEKEKEIFRSRGISYVGQMDLQKYMMENLLGVQSHFIYLVSKKNENSQTHKVVTWEEVFSCLDMDGMPDFAAYMVRKISE